MGGAWGWLGCSDGWGCRAARANGGSSSTVVDMVRERQRDSEREGENGERREQGLELGLPKTMSVGEVASMHERGVERGEPREPRCVETLGAISLCCCFYFLRKKKSNTTSNIPLKPPFLPSLFPDSAGI